MEKALARFRTIEKALEHSVWFKKEGWLVSLHGFPSAKPEFVTFHLFKKHWLNEDGQGIHIESYLSIDPKKLKTSYVTMHVLHHAKIPGTKLKRLAIAKPFVDTIFKEVSSWDGYKFRAGKYGVQPFTKLLDTGDGFEKELSKEATRVARKLGPVMDKVLRDVCP